MDKTLLLNVGLLSLGGALFGYTLFQIAARRISGREIGASVCVALGLVLVGLSLMPNGGEVGTLMRLTGTVSLLSGTLLTATTLRRGAPRLPPTGAGRIEGPRGDQRGADG
jgi:hypothetical protein